jgi:uncharacterized protein YegJ (DUF2314 family)
MSSLYRLVILACAFALASGASAGCKRKTADNGQNMATVEPGDPEIAAAVVKARSTLDDFIRAMKTPGAGKDFSVKVEFPHPDGSEFMWLQDISYDGHAFKGALDSNPVRSLGVKVGDSVTVERDKVQDWTYADDRGRVHGNFSGRVFIKRGGQKPAGMTFADD